jgi:hypothetical protein
LLTQISVPLAGVLNDRHGRDFVQGQKILATPELLPAPKEKEKEEKENEAVGFAVQVASPPGREKKMQQQISLLVDNPQWKSYLAKTGRVGEVEEITKKAFHTTMTRLSTLTIPATKLRRAMLPFPPSQLMEVYDEGDAIRIAVSAYDAFQIDVANKDFVHLPDVQGFLLEELSAAYKFLAQPHNAPLWEFCNPELVLAIRNHQIHVIAQQRHAFAKAVLNLTGQLPKEDTTLALAWSIIVESALLTDRLVNDMREASAAKGWAKLPDHWLPYYLPAPPPEARAAFNDYVRCRWPLIVFALDPVTDQQNIADVFSQRREMQLAVSLAFVSGQINARNMMRYARRIETDIETIALNNTAVGFSHGNETFGWRFYPRFQTGEIEGNAKVFFRDLIRGGPNRDDLLRQRRLEPGQRECVAIVMMPSFVPYAALETNSNFFSLVNPKHKHMNATNAVKLSASVKTIENCAPNVADADCYRAGEVERLLARAKQLEARLPTQNMQVQIPYENTLGGFAMFNTGYTDLAPELLGWYGAPAVNLDGPTTLFLVGNHFSVHQTRVIAGGQPVAETEMLSRQVMKVVIPANTLAIKENDGKVLQCAPLEMPMMPPANGKPVKIEAMASPPAPLPGEHTFVDVHLATPYGVTPHLLIPACHIAKPAAPAQATPAPTAAAWLPPALALAYIHRGLGIAPSDPPTIRPGDLAIKLNVPIPAAVDAADLVLTLQWDKGKAAVPIQGLAVRSGVIVFSNVNRADLIARVFEAAGRFLGRDDDNRHIDPAKLKIARTDIALRQGPLVVQTLPAATGPVAVSWIPASEPQIRVHLGPPH